MEKMNEGKEGSNVEVKMSRREWKKNRSLNLNVPAVVVLLLG